MANIAQIAQAPFISAASPALFQMDSWLELHNPRDLAKIHTTPEYALWRGLRESDRARFLALALPGVLARLPYGPRTDPVGEFDFEEDAYSGEQSKFVWMNAAYVMAANINRAFKQYGWCTRIQGIESGGAAEELPVYQVPTDEGVAIVGPTEIAIADRREQELASLGLLPLLQRKNSNIAAFFSAPSLQRPLEHGDPKVTAAAKISAGLPFVLACGRFAHYLKCMCRDRAAAWADADDAARWLNNWAKDYVDDDPAVSSEEAKAQRPLATAEVVLRENEDDPKQYDCRFFIRPQYQLDGLPVSVRVNLSLPTSRSY
jgi:type VI secretion system protein ImpC